MAICGTVPWLQVKGEMSFSLLYTGDGYKPRLRVRLKFKFPLREVS